MNPGIHEINRSINYFENGYSNNITHPERAYNCRARLNRILENKNEMISDIEKAFSYKKYYHNSIIELSKLYIREGNLEEGIKAMDLLVKQESWKHFAWSERGLLFQIMGDYEKSLIDFKQAYNISEKPNTLYDLGKAYYLNSEYSDSEKCYEKYISKYSWKKPYKDDIYHEGIIQFLDLKKGFGFLLTNTWFNKYDSVYFSVNNCKRNLNKGEVVRFKIRYSIHENKVVANAFEVGFDNILINKNYQDYKIYHAIIHNNGNSFKSVHDIKYIETFYPYSMFFNYESFFSLINERILKSLQNKGFAFVELILNFDEYNSPIISHIKELSYSNHYYKKYIKSRFGDYLSEPTADRGCYICGGFQWCGTDGCPFSPS